MYVFFYFLINFKSVIMLDYVPKWSCRRHSHPLSSSCLNWIFMKVKNHVVQQLFEFLSKYMNWCVLFLLA